MYLTKLFILFGIVLIITLDQTEGRRRWLNRTDKNIECSASKIEIVAGEDNTGTDQDPPQNGTEINNCRSRKWHQYRRTKCAVEVTNGGLNVNSTDFEGTHNVVPRRSKFGRRMKCNDCQWLLNQISINDKGSNATHSELPQSNNDERQNWHAYRKYRGRFAPRVKCENTQSETNPENNKESNENMLNNGTLPKMEESKPI